jgi:hypothetical protein
MKIQVAPISIQDVQRVVAHFGPDLLKTPANPT